MTNNLTKRMTKTGWIVVVVIIVVLVGGALLWSSSSSSTSTTPTAQNTVPADTGAQPGAADTNVAPGTDTSTSSSATQPPSASAPMTATVTYDGNTFTPATVTVAKGGTVTFTDTAGQMWIASDPHPAHSGYDGTSRSQHCAPGYTGAKPLDECSRGSSFTFTFDKVGSWGYHDHTNDSAHGVVNVVAAQ